MLRRLVLRDVVIVAELEVHLGPGFTVLTGETGAGKSILIDALQLALGQRADSSVVREGASRAEVSAEFDTPAALKPWLEEAGFAVEDSLLLRRTVETSGDNKSSDGSSKSADAGGRSRGWINGSPATMAQLRQAADSLVEIHGQHAWQSLTRPAAVRGLLDELAGVQGSLLAQRWQAWRRAQDQLDQARQQQDSLQRERERLAWQLAELDKLAPAAGEWESLNTEHQRVAHGQALLDGARQAQGALAEDDSSANVLVARALASLAAVERFDPELVSVREVLQSAQAQLEDAAHTLAAYLNHQEPDPERLAELDTRIGSWMAQARRYRRSPDELPALLEGWRTELAQLDAAADLEGLQRQTRQALADWQQEALRVSALRKKAAPKLASAVTQAMQTLGMPGGRFEVVVEAEGGDKSTQQPHAHGLDSVEFRVAGHAGSTPRALAKVASGGELSRLALAIAVCTGPAHGAATGGPGTLIFDEIDAGVGGTVADSVGRLMKQLGVRCQVLAVTHLAQVAACADTHFLVSKAQRGKQTLSAVQAVQGEPRVAEVARMLGGESLSGTAHAQALLVAATQPASRK